MPILSITSATVNYTLQITGVLAAAAKLQGFGVDEAFDTEAAETAVMELGVDGQSAAGWVPRLTVQTITLLPSSPSFLVFENWVAAMDAARDIIPAQGTILIPAVGRKYDLPNGVLTRHPALPNAKRVLRDRQFQITWSWPVTSSPI